MIVHSTVNAACVFTCNSVSPHRMRWPGATSSSHSLAVASPPRSLRVRKRTIIEFKRLCSQYVSGESKQKQAVILEINRSLYKSRTVDLESVRPFVIDELSLSVEGVAKKDPDAMHKCLASRVKALIARGRAMVRRRFLDMCEWLTAYAFFIEPIDGAAGATAW